MTPAIFGFSSLSLTDQERGFFRELDPAGYILFGRNIVSKAQVRALTDSLRALSGRDDLPILIDQEGGRVARLTQPEWPAFPPAQRFGLLHAFAPDAALEAARLNAQAIAGELFHLGITVDCLPVVDVPVPGAHDVIGDRAYGATPDVVAALAGATLEGLRQGGVVGVVKHIPGHGRAGADSHEALPVVNTSASVLSRTDFAAFRPLADAPMAMTAHVLYSAIDPERCASVSRTIIQDVIRADIGFGGLLMCDDLSMKALGGSFAERTAQALHAGCDVVLHCNGVMAEMTEIAQALPSHLTPEAATRLARAMAWPQHRPADPAALAAARDRLLAMV
jgi:beta-N-acetylhexosaminidase